MEDRSGSYTHLVSSSPTEGADVCAADLGAAPWTPGGAPTVSAVLGPAPLEGPEDEHESAYTGSGNTRLKVSLAPVGGETEKVLD